ncbi:ABC transporter [Burkholderia diffusa]|uniref:ABC transporter n=1 Tax=Burkholderia diffusa TaxID=488732 RepID=A0A6P2MFZ7_9BURK|nr:ABC transporter [Burkholderia diffusa]
MTIPPRLTALLGRSPLTRTSPGIGDFPDLAGKTVVTNQGTTSERVLRKMNEEKKMTRGS